MMMGDDDELKNTDETRKSFSKLPFPWSVTVGIVSLRFHFHGSMLDSSGYE